MDLLHLVEFAWNNHYHQSIKMTPVYVNFGRQLVLTDRPPMDSLSITKRVEQIHKLQKDIEGDLHLAS